MQESALLKNVSHLSLVERNPLLVEHARERAEDVQNRIADQITAFAGSMRFVYIHIIWFGCWIGLGIEKYPYGLLTMIVSLEAIFLSTFVMISQNRADAKRQVIADQQWQAEPGTARPCRIRSWRSPGRSTSSRARRRARRPRSTLSKRSAPAHPSRRRAGVGGSATRSRRGAGLGRDSHVEPEALRETVDAAQARLTAAKPRATTMKQRMQ